MMGPSRLAAKGETCEFGAPTAEETVMADPSDADPEDRDPEEVEMQRRSDLPTLSPWLILGVIAMLAVGVYAVSALL